MERKQKTAKDYDFEIAKGNEANLILQNETLNSVLNQIEASAVKKMIDSNDSEERDVYWHQVRAIRSLRAELTNIASSGKIAAKRKAELQ